MSHRYRHYLVVPVLLLLIGTAAPARACEQPADALLSQTRLVTVWGCPMCESVRQYEFGRCPKCGMSLVPLERKRLYGAAALMPGAPQWLFYAAAISVLLLSFVLFHYWGRRQSAQPQRGFRWNLLRIPGIKWLVKRRWFQFSLQFPVFILFMIVIVAGLMGNPDPTRNIAPALTWAFWWTWLIVAVLFMGKIWCTACPWMGVSDWLAKSSFWRRVRKPFSADNRWPKRLRNIWIATISFVALTWLELGFGITQKPWLTATLALVMVMASVLTLLVYERKAFCRYACLVGRVQGLYAMLAGTELRRDDANVCRACVTKDCYHGNENAYPCPTHQFIGAMDVNTYCTLCTECIKACPEDNIVWNTRPVGADLLETSKVRSDEAFLAIALLSMSAFHGLTMTPLWVTILRWFEGTFGAPHLLAFSVAMTGILALPLGVYYGICWLMKWSAGDHKNSAGRLFVRFAYSLLPIALFYHLAHNAQHILFEGKKLVRLASDPFGLDWNLFGTASMPVDMVLPLGVGWGMQVALILFGHIYGIRVAHKISRSLYDQPRQAVMSQIPILAGMLLFSFQSLWLIAQPMIMRTAM
ncbi:MAG: heavy metal-binding domain-containing protein [Candidatus Krumholzibacteriia bacterium]